MFILNNKKAGSFYRGTIFANKTILQNLWKVEKLILNEEKIPNYEKMQYATKIYCVTLLPKILTNIKVNLHLFFRCMRQKLNSNSKRFHVSAKNKQTFRTPYEQSTRHTGIEKLCLCLSKDYRNRRLGKDDSPNSYDVT